NAPSPDEVVVSVPFVAISSGCGPVSARFKTTRKGTTLRAAWPECREPRRKLVLKAEIDPTCKFMTGMLIGRKLKLKRRFVATLSECGDGCQPGFANPPPPSPPSKSASAPAKTASEPGTPKSPPSTGGAKPSSSPAKGVGPASSPGFGNVPGEPLLEENRGSPEVPGDVDGAPESGEVAGPFADVEEAGLPLKGIFGVDLPGSHQPRGSRDPQLHGKGLREGAALLDSAND